MSQPLARLEPESPAPAMVATPARRGVLAFVRREEAMLLWLLLLGIALCVSSGTGFTPGPVIAGYFAFFTPYLLYCFALTRVVALARGRWRMAGGAGRLGGRLAAWLGRPSEGAGPALSEGAGPAPADGAGLLAADLELVRGIVLLLVSLTVYTNIKARIPFINRAVGDGAFLALDRLLLPDGLIPWIERTTAASARLADLLTSVYFHDYLWMVVLVALFWVRGDRARLRWTFVSVCFVYLLGILMTAAYPSYGPFFFERERFAWLAETPVGLAQRGLAGTLVASTRTVAEGGALVAQPFSGVAAFPSLHVAHMVILMVIAWRPWRLFALFVGVIALLTTIATVAFGWHYLVDAVGGAALAAVVTLALEPFAFDRARPWRRARRERAG